MDLQMIIDPVPYLPCGYRFCLQRARPGSDPASVRRPSGLAGIATLLKQLSHQGCPASLMARPEALSGVAVKILIEENEIAPVGIDAKLWHATVHRTVS